MKYSVWKRALAMGGVLTVTVTLSACVGRWFETRPETNGPTPAAAPGNFKTSTVTYIHELCALPREQREPQLRELNEELLPNHAVISCGRGGTP